MEDHARAFSAAVAEFGDRLRSVKLPEPGVSAYHLYLEGGEAFLSATDHAVIDEWAARDRLMSVLFDLHAHYAVDLFGEGRVDEAGALLGHHYFIEGVIVRMWDHPLIIWIWIGGLLVGLGAVVALKYRSRRTDDAVLRRPIGDREEVAA